MNSLVKNFLMLCSLHAVATAQILTAVNPNHAEQNQTLKVTITGQNTRFAQGSGTTNAWFVQGGSIINAATVAVNNDTSLSANFTIPRTAVSGLWDVAVQPPFSGVLTLRNGFTIRLATPTNLTAIAVSNNQINLSWMDNSGTEEAFAIERKLGVAGVFQEIAVVGTNVTNYQDTGLTPQTQYCYRVRAFDAGGNSAYSNESCATASNLTPLITAVNPNRAAQNQALTVTITGRNSGFAQGSGTTSVRFARGSATINASTFMVLNDTLLQGNFIIPRSALSGLWDAAVQTFSNGLLTLPQAFTVVLAPPANLRATAVSSSQIDLRWPDNSDTELGYKIERKLSSGIFQQIAAVGANVTAYSATNLAPLTQYCFRVYAFAADDSSAYSNESCTTTPSLPIMLVAISPNFAEQSRTLSVTITGQNTHFAQGTGTTSVSFAQGSSTINATSSLANNDLSLSANFTIPRAAPTGLWDVAVQTPIDGLLRLTNGFNILLIPPSNLTATPISNTQINLAWIDNSGTEQGYRIERQIGSSVFEEIAVIEANATAYQNTGLTPQTQCCYRVRAFEAASVSNYSNEACVSTPTSVNAGRSAPAQYQLAQNYPNPFSANGISDNLQTKIEYSLAERGAVRLEIFDVHGRKIRTLIRANQPPNHYAVTWEGKDDRGALLPSGIYFYRLQAGKFEQTRKLVLAK